MTQIPSPHRRLRPGRRSSFAVAVLLAALTVPRYSGAQELPTPAQFAGFQLGSEDMLLRWDKIVDYMRLVAQASPRVQVVDLGKSTLGRPFIMVIVSSEANMRNLDRIKEINRRIYDPASIRDDADARNLVEAGKTVVAITCNIHSTEIAASQIGPEVVYRMATENSAYMQNILDNTVFLLFPSINPDGQAMVVDWHDQQKGSEYPDARMPWLYHYYTGHDDNRDAYMFSQAETRLSGQVLYHDWFPEIWLDEHQMGANGARLFVMPAGGPTNPNVDPWIYRTAGLLGFAQGQALDAEGKPGVIYSSTYTYWWQGAMAWSGWWHNQVGMLTEAASVNLAKSTYQPVLRPDGTTEPVPPEAEPFVMGGRGGGGGFRGGRREYVKPSPEYLDPWEGGWWRLRDIMDYEETATFALLDASADMRENLLTGIVAVNRRTLAKGQAGNPYAIVIPAAQHDPLTADKLAHILYLGGVHVQRATAPFTAGGKQYAAGSFVIPMQQVFRNYVKDLLEPQVYPSEEAPYDVTGWSLGMQMGVETDFVKDAFTWQGVDAGADPTPEGRVTGSGSIYLLDGRLNDSFTGAMKLLRDGKRVGRMTAPATVGGQDFPAGTFVVSGADAAAMTAAVKDIGLTAVATNQAPDGTAWMEHAPRVALYQPWGGNMNEGWTRYVLDTFDFQPITIHPEDVRGQKNLASKYDAIIFPDMNVRSIMEGITGDRDPPKYRGGIDESGLEALKAFAQGGGTVITLGSSSNLLLQSFDAPYDTVPDVPREEFLCPGSILEMQVTPDTPETWGMPSTTDVMFANEMVMLPKAATGGAGTVLMKFGDSDPLKSGWLRGPEHLYEKIGAASVPYGKGRIVLLPVRVQRRAQTHGAFKLLFNPIVNSVLPMP
jgi:hypothetical protein